MRKRNVHVQFWLDKKEAEAFNKKVKRSGLSLSLIHISVFLQKKVRNFST